MSQSVLRAPRKQTERCGRQIVGNVNQASFLVRHTTLPMQREARVSPGQGCPRRNGEKQKELNPVTAVATPERPSQRGR
ncbi:Lymphocyte Antigen 75 [Manis pentadactyla]|nr:Lymphocyte Antigen 75 [Manis pentadactyla]